MPEDRRKKHSRERICNAMIDCLFQVSLDRVTVKMICAAADINRSTFYAHYPDPLSVYEQIEREAVDKMENHVASMKLNKITYNTLLVQIFEYVKQNDRTILALLKTNSESFKRANLELLRKQGVWHFDEAITDLEYTEEYFVSAIQSVIYKWLSTSGKESPEHMADLIYKLTIDRR